VVFIRRQDLPAAFVVVPETPDPVLLAKLRRPQTGAGVQRDNVVAFLRRVSDLVPDRFRILVAVGDVGRIVGEVEHRFAARHLGPAVRFGWIGILVAGLPLASWQLEDGETWPVADTDDAPF